MSNTGKQCRLPRDHFDFRIVTVPIGVRHIDDIYITQPYAPTLFSQGDLPGPELLLKFQRRELSMSELKQAWDERRKKNKPSRSKWPESMELYCRGCSERTGEEINKPLTQFQYTNLDTVWEEVISKGMERFCRRCAKAENTGEASASRSAETPDTCAWCRKAIDSKCFANLRLCTSCSGLRFKCTKCSKSAQTPIFKPLSAFALERMLKCKEQRTLTNRACCL